ncbi:PucR C-terminal helix-turn-helix domain [Rubrobacter radiotolerans]|uniref:Helix-turn-helix domain-containing protein n=1 Tax=Rubrobacter radiotolerans TaxID=42256 RepID=A0A023X4W6_RUBRA|nr:helix-turn-helix domain-containing protein [Rubrobacter radiotolerans]AHY47079.1 PucR C-terminal helix-turn-helix domain [Rubrobacter radiotolerans]MDX5894484.1 helix-turn-helix domain-containing protein [Rubrobacter radiotolerans]SMC06100.1 DNA-binding transcriptional regulator, PucR family [Rubrobacter radiotolerans DSM 5868]
MNLGELKRVLQDELEARVLVPGDNSRAVTGLSVEESGDSWLLPGDLLLVQRPDSGERWTGLLAEAGENSSPAILFREKGEDGSKKPPPEEVLAEARRRGVAVIALPGDVSLGRIASMLYREGQRGNDLLKLSHRASRELGSVSGDEVSLESVTARVSGMLGRPVVLEDAVGRLIPASPEDAQENGLISALHEHGLRASRGTAGVEETRRERRDRYARLPEGFLSVPIERWRVGSKEGRELYWTPVGEKTPSGYLWLDLEGHSLEPEDVVNLYWARRVLKTELEKDRIRLETELGVRGDFVDDLISGHYGSVDLLLQRARYLGADLTEGALVLIVDIDDFARYLERRRLKEPAIQELKRRLADAVRLQSREVFSNFLTGPRSDNVILLVGPSKNESAEEIPEKAHLLASRIQRYVRGLLPDLTVSVGLGRFTPDPARLSEAYSEAEVALEIGHRIYGPSSVSTFERTGTYKLLFKVLQGDPQELETFYAETLAPVVHYDERYGTELIHTLTTYLNNDASTVKTASELFAHRHTIRYRLDRIGELTDLDIEKTEDRERLTLGIKAMQLLGRAPNRPSPISDR